MLKTFLRLFFISLFMHEIIFTNGHVLPQTNKNMSESELDRLINLAFGLNIDNSNGDIIKTDKYSDTKKDTSKFLQPEEISSTASVITSAHVPEKRDADIKPSSTTESIEEDADPLNLGCICVPQEDCDQATGKISTNLEGLIDERSRTCERPQDILCCINSTSDPEEKDHSQKNNLGVMNHSSDSTKKTEETISSQLSDRISTNKEDSFKSSDDFTCFCRQGSTLNSFQQKGSYSTNQCSDSTSSGSKWDTGLSSDELRCVCKRKQTPTALDQNILKTSFGHHHIYSPNKETLESANKQSEELYCTCEYGQTQSTTNWSYGQTQETGEITGASQHSTGEHQHISGIENNSGGSYASSHSQSSSSASSGQSGSNSNEGSTSGTINYGQQGYGSEKDISSGLSGSSSQSTSYSHSTNNASYGQHGNTNSNTGSSYVNNENINYGTANEGDGETSHLQTSASSHGQSGTSGSNTDLYQTTGQTDYDKESYNSGISNSSSSSNSYAYAHSQSESHSSAGTSYVDGSQSHGTDETTSTYLVSSSTDYGKDKYTDRTDSNAGESHSYSGSQSNSHSSAETNQDTGDKEHTISSGIHTTDGSNYNQHHTTGIKGSTDSTYSHSQSEAESHSSAEGTGIEHIHSTGSTVALHEHGGDNKYELGHTTESTSHNGLTNSYSSSQSQAESHTSSGQTGYDNNYAQNQQGTSTSHVDEKDFSQGHQTTGSTASSSSDSYAESHAYAEAHSQATAGSSYGYNGQDNSSSSHQYHGHTSGTEGGTGSTISSGGTSYSGQDNYSHGEGGSTSNSYQGTSEHHHGQDEHTSGSGGTTSGSHSHSESNTQTLSHSSEETDKEHESQYHVHGGTGSSSQHEENSSGSAANIEASNSYAQSQSSSSSSGGTSYGQDGYSQNTGSSQQQNEEKHHGQYGHTSGTENTNINQGYSSSNGQTHVGEGSGSMSQSHATAGSSSGSYSSSHGSSEGSDYNQHGYNINNNNNGYNSSSNHLHSPDQSNYEGCGYSKYMDVAQRIKNDSPDSESLFGQFPWMVALLTKTKNSADEHKSSFTFVCGGSLLHHQVILSATHCIVKKDIKSLVVRAGEWNVQANDEILPYQQEEVEKIIRHPDYYSGGLYNDVSLIFTKKPFKFADNIDIVCLPPPSYNFDYTEKCLVSGWGKESLERSSKYQPILRQVELPLVPRHECQEKLRKTRLGDKFKLHDSFICAGGELNQDTCKGDGGGPLVCPIKGSIERYHQLGIVSWGVGCGSETPAVYVNVKSYVNWIDQQMQKANLKPHYRY